MNEPPLADWSALEAAGERARERSLREQAAASATVAGLFVDAAERGASVSVVLAGGAGTVAGRVSLVGADFAVVDRCYVPLAAVAVVRGGGGGAAGGSDRRGDDMTLVSALSRLAEERPAVAVTVDGHVATGELVAVSDEVLTLSTGWVALAAVRALRLV